MKKSAIFFAIITLLFTLNLKSEIVVKVGGAYSGAFNVDNLSLKTTWQEPDYNAVTFNETNISSFSGSSGFGFEAGVAFFFNYNIGLSIDVSMMKTTYDISNKYNLSWVWYDGTNGSDTKDWNNNTGSLTVVPINIDFLYRMVMGDNIKVTFGAGGTLFLAKLDLNGNFGDARFYYDPSDHYFYIDWFDINMFNSVSKTAFGGNAMFEFEYSISESMAIYFGAKYYFGGSVTENWFEKEGVYTGEYGILVIDVDDTEINSYAPSFSLSTFSLSAGIKVYL